MNGRFRLCAAVVLGTVWLAGPPGTPAEPPQPEASEAWFKNHALAEGALQRILSNGAFWTKRAHKEELLACLRAARTLRSAALAPVLADHIDFQPVYTGFSKEEYGNSDDAHVKAYETLVKDTLDLTGGPCADPAPFEKRYPAAAALIAIGMPAVPLILDQMRHLEVPPLPPKTASEADQAKGMIQRRGRQWRAWLLMRCLFEIYNGGGGGAPMAELRVQLEAEKATGTEKENLLRFLETDAYRKPWKP